MKFMQSKFARADRSDPHKVEKGGEVEKTGVEMARESGAHKSGAYETRDAHEAEVAYEAETVCEKRGCNEHERPAQIHNKAPKSQDISLHFAAEDREAKYDKDRSGNIELRESFALGLALTVNNIGLGISASVIGLNVIITSIASFACSILLVYISNLFGKNYISNFFGKYSEPIASILIILLGLYGIFN